MELSITRLIETLLLPPASLLFVALLGLLLIRRWPRIGYLCATGALLLLTVLSLPVTGRALLHTLEHTPPLSLARIQHSGAGAIVVLGAGRYWRAPEYGGQDTPSRQELERLRYAAYLQRQTHLPILVSGGAPFGEKFAEAVLMARCLHRDFHAEPVWVEGASRNTAENARDSAAMLRREGIRKVLLVTHAWHMPRALEAFHKTGVTVVPAPVGFATPDPDKPGLIGWLPHADGLSMSRRALREWLGQLWYALRY
jgi:uncharacterized SAM-binding protein YcdF (DUF218 family)